MAGAIDIPYNSLSAAQKGKRKPSRYTDDTRSAPAAQALFFYVTAVLDFGATIAAGVVEDRTITLLGAAVGDVIAVSPQDDPGTTVGVVWSARVSAADTISVRLANPTTGTVTLVNRTWNAVLTRLE